MSMKSDYDYPFIIKVYYISGNELRLPFNSKKEALKFLHLDCGDPILRFEILKGRDRWQQE